MMRGTKVLLTGAAGFIGSHVARLLVQRGCRVTAVIRPGSNTRRLADLTAWIAFVEGDLEDVGFCRAFVGSLAPDVLIHLAWYLEPGRWPDSARHLDCLSGSLALLQGVVGTDCRRVVIAGTSAEYDDGSEAATEARPVWPRDLYGACKASLALVGSELARQQGWAFAQARVFNVYGPGEDERRLVPYLVRSLLRGEPCEITPGEQVRDYLHVEDVASAFVALAASDVEGPVNVASSEPITVAALAGMIATLVGRPELLRVGSLKARPGDPRCLYADSSLLRNSTGWRPRYGLGAGLRQTIGWWENTWAAAG